MFEHKFGSQFSPEEFRNHIELMRVGMGVRNIEFQPRPNRGLYAQTSATPDNCTVRTRCDYAITPSVLVNHHWEIEQIFFTREVTSGHHKTIVIDVGANMGMFSRQVLGWSQNIHHLFAYEPEPENFACLLHNLSCFGNYTAEMVGLAENDAKVTLHMDVRNCGNNSIVSGQLAGALYKTTMDVMIRSIAQESRRWLAFGLPIFYKSDTQGYDELLVTLLPDDVRDAMVGGIIEVEQIEKPPFSRERFREFLDSFNNKAILLPETENQPVTTDEVVAMLDQKSPHGVNVCFWR